MRYPPPPLLLILSLCLLPGACSDDAQGPSYPPPDPPKLSITAAPQGDVNMLVAGLNTFALDMHRRLAQSGDTGGGNVVFSPFGVHSTMAMAMLGAPATKRDFHGATREQMQEVLHVRMLDARLRGTHSTLLHRVLGAGKTDLPYQLYIASAAWGQEGYAFEKEYISQVREFWGAPFFAADFAEAFDDVRVEINDWAARHTAGQIPQVMPVGVLNKQTRLVLTNAIYFDAKWAQPFAAHQTSMRSFDLADGTEVNVPMMHRFGKLSYAAADGFEMVMLPYEGQDAAMLIVLPARGRTIEAFENGLTREALRDAVAALSARPVSLALPRFAFGYLSNLRKAFEALGMTLPFGDDADLTQIGRDGAGRSLRLDAVMHRAMIEVGEVGTRAAAATAASSQGTSGPPDDTIVFTANRPFLFIVRHTRTGAFLFMGRVGDPR